MTFLEFCDYSTRPHIQLTTPEQLRRFEQAIRPLPEWAIPTSLGKWLELFHAVQRVQVLGFKAFGVIARKA